MKKLIGVCFRMHRILIVCLTMQLAIYEIAPADTAVDSTTQPSAVVSVEQFARAYEKNVMERDIAAITAKHDLPRLLHRMFKTKPGDKLPVEFEMLMKRGIQWGESLAQQLGHNGTYKFLRTRIIDGETRALFRMIGPNGEINFHDMVLETNEHGSLAIVDNYVYTTGEYLSETMGRYMQIEPANAQFKNMADGFRTTKKMTEHFQKQEYKQVLDLYDTLPEELKAPKATKLLCVVSALKVNPPNRDEIVEDYVTAFPGDPSLNLVLLDHHFLNEKWDEALGCVDALQESTGGDAYLHTLSATIALRAGRLEEARAFAAKAIAQEPELISAYWTTVEIALTRQDYAEVAKWLTTIENDLGIRLGDLKSNPMYSGFVQSPEYETWMSSRKTADQPSTPAN